MIPETGERIFNNDYVDLFIHFPRDLEYFERFTDATVQLLDLMTAVVRIPSTYLDNSTISKYGYSAVPILSGIVDQADLEASGITRLRNIPNLNLRGQGVLIGILDTGIDYTNPIFRYPDNTTKIAALWDQTIYGENYSTNTYYGTEYTREQINQALQSQNPYEIVPSRDEIGHGTMLAGIAAGNEVPEKGFSGVTPDAELVIVKLKPAKQNLKDFWKIPTDAVCYQSNDIAFALEYLEITANKLGRPMSICVALGSSQGPHDNSLILNYLLSLRSENLNFTITIAGGNEGNARRHYYSVIDPSIGYDTVELKVGNNEKGFSMELWGDSPGLFAMDITSPSGEYISRIIPRVNEYFKVSFIFDNTIILIDYQVVEAQSGDQLILLRFSDPAPGIWTFHIYGKGDLSLSFHIWLPMDGFISGDTFFLKSDPDTTLLSFANATEPITVTSYNTANDSLYLNVSKGYTRTGNIKPEIAAPGVNITSPNLDQGFSPVSGTSPAAAFISGVAAIILEWGIVNGNLPLIKTSDVKGLMIRGARRDPTLTYPNQDWGYGILNVYHIFESLRSSI
ncbi:S8 family peptidase [Anaerosacchariphilus polymeriproducens]|uniref:Peptidase n=1 Tax=Anaerosacchariphilus polymeriproducens TaxID=1812858 RepID=A0A371AVW2_9FIRM|nr:S8 family peptidase [Anaerosacchariphilus polymeriproducens]RDU23708.1 peptidase [Anaerosacchariphilus polymeriproducens]